MTARGLTTSIYRGNMVRGRIAGARGLIHNLHIETDASEPVNPILAWTHTLPDATQPTANNIVRLWRDGALEKTVYSAARAVVAPVRSGGYVNYETEAVTPLEDVLIDSSRAFAVYPQGDRAKINWTECTAQDFGAYLLYWNGGGTATPTTLLRTVRGAQNVTAVSGQLVNGTTYKFGLKIRDNIGNVTAIGTIASIVADTQPKALENPTISFSIVTRRATITGHHPVDQHTDLGEVCLYNNNIPAIGLSDYPNVGHELRRATAFTTTGTVSFTTEPLYPGTWKFAARVVDRFGLQSAYSVLTLPIKQVGTSLAIGSITPLAPVGLIAYGTAAAGAVLRWTHGGANTSAYKAYSGPTLLATITDTTLRRTTIAGLTDAQQYSLYMVAYNGAVASASSNIATATMDGAAPAGARALTLELIH